MRWRMHAHRAGNKFPDQQRPRARVQDSRQAWIPAVTPFLAQTIDIEIARYDGSISAVNANNFTYTRKFATATDNYMVTLPYI